MAELKAIFFDQDGVIVDTERDGHRVAFNRTFAEFGLKAEWSVEEYHQLLQIGGGKERMLHYLRTKGFGVPVPADQEQELIKKLHKRKTDMFIELIESGALPLRPGIHRLMREAQTAGVALGICTTSDERAAKAISGRLLGDVKFQFILAGDVVSRKKPDPEIYLLAMKKAGLTPAECLVVEDSRNGVLAAKAAGIRTLVTLNGYTEGEDVSPGDIIVTSLGEPAGPRAELRSAQGLLAFNGVVTLSALKGFFRRA
jgi:HAD superfamily hydrolase (TIGR01509 family)